LADSGGCAFCAAQPASKRSTVSRAAAINGVVARAADAEQATEDALADLDASFSGSGSTG
jgi:hypothetical protein